MILTEEDLNRVHEWDRQEQARMRLEREVEKKRVDEEKRKQLDDKQRKRAGKAAIGAGKEGTSREEEGTRKTSYFGISVRGN